MKQANDWDEMQIQADVYIEPMASKKKEYRRTNQQNH